MLLLLLLLLRDRIVSLENARKEYKEKLLKIVLSLS